MDSDEGRVGSAAEEMKRQMALQMQRFSVTQMAGRAAAEHTKKHLNPARESRKHREVQLLSVQTCNPCRLSKFSADFFTAIYFRIFIERLSCNERNKFGRHSKIE